MQLIIAGFESTRTISNKLESDLVRESIPGKMMRIFSKEVNLGEEEDDDSEIGF